MSVWSVAITTGPRSASQARRQTCTIIGVPWISASGLPGNLVAANRDGTRTIWFMLTESGGVIW